METEIEVTKNLWSQTDVHNTWFVRHIKLVKMRVLSLQAPRAGNAYFAYLSRDQKGRTPHKTAFKYLCTGDQHYIP